MATRKERTIEILAPAGSVEALRAAVLAGCDAVYIGGSHFGARAYADNPETDALLEAIAFAHCYGVKVYLTVNTLLKEEELAALVPYLMPYYKGGIDAVIVQDFGVLETVVKHFPDLPVHASTQMTLTHADALSFLPKQVTRIVPARELTIDELRELSEQTGLELEVFCHGALCYSYSGQCLMSSMIGGRSGNRGRCAQPCRKRYQVIGVKKNRPMSGYWLSPKDQCMLLHLPELLRLGIDSLKIEGRMKQPVYAAGVTAIYRKWVDRLQAGNGTYDAADRAELLQDVEKLAELYNRGGFTGGYPFSETGSEMMAVRRPNHSGIKVGTASIVQGGMVADIRYSAPVGSKDVLELRGIVDGEEVIVGEYTAGANETQRRLKLRRRTEVTRADVYRTRNEALLSELVAGYEEHPKKIPVEGVFYAAPGQPMSLSILGQESIFLEGDVVEEAKGAPATVEQVQAALGKTGGTKYQFAALEVQLDGACFLPNAALNRLRREALQRYEEAVLQSFCREAPAEAETKQETVAASCEERNEWAAVVSVMTKEQLLAVVNQPDVLVLIDAEGEAEDCLRAIGEKPFGLLLPRIASDAAKQLSRKLLELGSAMPGFLVICIRNLAELAWMEALAAKPRLWAEHCLYTMNGAAAGFLRRLGISRIGIPLEENERELTWSRKEPALLTVYERTTVMTSKQCVFKTTEGCRPQHGAVLTLRDETGAVFPAQKLCRLCQNRVYNSRATSLLSMPEALAGKENCLPRIAFTIESADEAAQILAAFREGREPELLKGQVTRGHWNRGVL